MIALFDVNVLVALFDPDHVHHRSAHDWLAANREAGWATCPLTENGLVRILSNPTYSGRRTTIEDAVDRLEAFRASGDHRFWPDTVSLCQRVCSPSRTSPATASSPTSTCSPSRFSTAAAWRLSTAAFDRTPWWAPRPSM